MEDLELWRKLGREIGEKGEDDDQMWRWRD